MKNDDDGQAFNFLIKKEVEPGTYYVAVRHYSSSRTGKYKLKIDWASSDFQVSKHIENTSLKFKFKIGDKLSSYKKVKCKAIKVSYIAHSQSQTNYKQNKVEFILSRSFQESNHEQEIIHENDYYNSQSTWGTPIPSYNHSFNYKDINFTPGEELLLKIIVTSGDYKNYLSSFQIESIWEKSEQEMPKDSLDLKISEHIESTTQKYPISIGRSIVSNNSKLVYLKLIYKAHSQSMTNYKKNSVSVQLIKSGTVIGEYTDRYNSQSKWGTPIPGYIRSYSFQEIDSALKKGDKLTVKITVSDGDWRNYLSSVSVLTRWK
jgi:hypothetical protein